MVTFVDESKTKHKRDPGRCYIRAGAQRDGKTKGGLVAVRFTPETIRAIIAAATTPAIEGAEEGKGR